VLNPAIGISIGIGAAAVKHAKDVAEVEALVEEA